MADHNRSPAAARPPAFTALAVNRTAVFRRIVGAFALPGAACCVMIVTKVKEYV